jgi:hypothetical protein
MGIMIISYTIKDITDDVGYLQVIQLMPRRKGKVVQWLNANSPRKRLGFESHCRHFLGSPRPENST